jgi:hypothetical protein
MSRPPHLRAIRRGLKDGANLNPSLLYIPAPQRIMGDSLVATLVPAILGFLVMLMYLFQFVAVRRGGADGYAGMFLAGLSEAYQFAYKGRSYGMVPGFGGLSLRYTGEVLILPRWEGLPGLVGR